MTASGRTQALQALTVADVRPVDDNDLLAVRSAAPVRDVPPNVALQLAKALRNAACGRML